MISNTIKSIRELAVEIPGAPRIFEELGIDYCCGGDRSLEEACLAVGVPVEGVLSLLARAEPVTGEATEGEAWEGRPLSELISYIVSKHHAFTREELVRLSRLLTKVCSAHAQNHPELLLLKFLLRGLEQELTAHMRKEEQVLFPYIEEIENTVRGREPLPPPFVGTVSNRVRMAIREHDNAGRILQKMRHLSSDYRPPADGCTSFQALYQALEAFERDLHQHIHLENNILFPRALEVENQFMSILKAS